MSGSGYRSIVGASTSGGGWLRVRRPRPAGGPVVVSSPSDLVLGATIGLPCTLVALVAAGILVLPPWDESPLGVLILLVLTAVCGGFGGFGLWVARLGLSRLEIDPADGRVRAVGRRWTIPADRPAHARAVRLERGPLARHQETLQRRTWVLRLACGESPPPRDAAGGDPPDEDLAFLRTLELVKAWKLPTVRARGAELAEALGVPFEDAGPAVWDPDDRSD